MTSNNDSSSKALERQPVANTQALIPNDAPGFRLVPQNFAEAMQFAEMISKTDLVPKDYKGKPGNVMVAMQMGMELSLPPLMAIQSIAIINGRPSLFGDGLLAVCQSHASFVDIVEILDDETLTATCTVTRRGRAPVTRTFSMEEAMRAGLDKKSGPWSTHPKRMVQMRARAFALRDMFADVLRGVASAEVTRDEDGELQAVPRTPYELKAHGTKAAEREAAIEDAILCTDSTRCHDTPSDELDGAVHAVVEAGKAFDEKKVLEVAARAAESLCNSDRGRLRQETKLVLQTVRDHIAKSELAHDAVTGESKEPDTGLPTLEQITDRLIAANDIAQGKGMLPEDWHKHAKVAAGAEQARTWEDLDKVDAYVEAFTG